MPRRPKLPLEDDREESAARLPAVSPAARAGRADRSRVDARDPGGRSGGALEALRSLQRDHQGAHPARRA